MRRRIDPAVVVLERRPCCPAGLAYADPLVDRALAGISCSTRAVEVDGIRLNTRPRTPDGLSSRNTRPSGVPVLYLHDLS